MQGKKTWVEIKEAALRSNIGALRSLLSNGVRMIGVVKANAYGHGIEQVVPIMLDEQIEYFAVDNIDEAIVVRKLAPGSVIIILGYTVHERLADVLKYRLDQVVYDQDTLLKLQEIAAQANSDIRVHIKVETGTLRQGVRPEQLSSIIKVARSCTNLRIVGLSTHFANIEEANDTTFAEYQIAKFQEAFDIVNKFGVHPKLIHTACSAALILYPQTHGTLARPGISLYGFWPSRETRNRARILARQIELDPVLTWKTRIAQIKEAPMGDPIGYGCTERLRRYSKIAIIPVGYADGYDRGLSSIGEVIIHGQLCKVLGRICMNMFMVDVTEVPKIKGEDQVLLIGREGKNRMRAEDVAQKINTIHYEVTTRINPLITRVVV